MLTPRARVSAAGGALTEPCRPLTSPVAPYAPSHRLQPADSSERTAPGPSVRDAFVVSSDPARAEFPRRDRAEIPRKSRLTDRAQNPAHPFAVFAIAARVSFRVATSVRLCARLSPCARDAYRPTSASHHFRFEYPRPVVARGRPCGGSPRDLAIHGAKTASADDPASCAGVFFPCLPRPSSL